MTEPTWSDDDAPSYRRRRPSGAAMRFDDAEPVTVVLVRHGETTMTQGKELSGSSEPGPELAQVGREQARHAALTLAEIGGSLWADLPRPSALRASPLTRTQQTAAAIAERLDLAVVTDPAFAECDFGAWQGLRPDEVEERWPGALERWYAAQVPAPDGESLPDVGVRVAAGLGHLLQGGAGRTVVVVSHVMAIRAAVGVSLGAPAASWTWVRVLPGSLTVLQWWPDGMREVVATGLVTDR